MDKASLVFDVFEHIAEGYDQANDRISLGMQRRWKKMLTDRIIKQIPPGSKILDLCCGTGDIAIEIAKHRPDVSVTGMDFSPAMLKVASAKLEAMALKNLEFIQGDAMALPQDDDTFTAVTISFGLRNTSDYKQVISEMKRVLKRGGCAYCIDSFVPEWEIVKPFYKIYFNQIMPLLGGGHKYKKEYQWLSCSTDQFLKPTELIQLFEQVGFTRVRKQQKMFGACVLIWGRKDSNNESR